jgi:hypothetical protein
LKAESELKAKVQKYQKNAAQRAENLKKRKAAQMEAASSDDDEMDSGDDNGGASAPKKAKKTFADDKYFMAMTPSDAAVEAGFVVPSFLSVFQTPPRSQTAENFVRGLVKRMRRSISLVFFFSLFESF